MQTWSGTWFGVSVSQVCRLSVSLTSASSGFLSYFGQRTNTLHMAVRIYGVSVERQGRVKGEKPNNLEGEVIQGEFFCFKMRHAVLLSVGPERWYKGSQEGSKLLIIKKINPRCQFSLCRCDQEWQMDFSFPLDLFSDIQVYHSSQNYLSTLLSIIQTWVIKLHFYDSLLKTPEEYSHTAFASDLAKVKEHREEELWSPRSIGTDICHEAQCSKALLSLVCSEP